MGGAGQPAGGPERSDASGLLGGSDEPWLETGLADVIVAGAAAGGAGLAGLGTRVADGPPEQDFADENASADEDATEQPVTAELSTSAETKATQDTVTASAAGSGAAEETAEVMASVGGSDVPEHAEKGHARHHEPAATGSAVPAPAGETPEDIAAWDTAVAGAVVLMGGTVGVDGPDDPPDDPGLAKWRPVPTEPGAAPAAEPGLGLGLGLRASGSGEYAESAGDAEENAAEAGSFVAAEEEETRGAAGLLIEDASLWGTWQSDPGALG
jgi:hypothetical protein